MRAYYLSVICGEKRGAVAAGLRAGLRVLSWIYSAGVFSLRRLYSCGILRARDLGCPVISVGNITWGGVGKTPLVEKLVKDLVARGRRPAVLTRGYMPLSVQASGHVCHSDEAQLLRERFSGHVPVIARKDRVRGAQEIPPDYGCDVIVLDDGFQHWRVKRDLDIVVVDALDPFGNGCVIPRGNLREPLSALHAADVCVISRANLASCCTVDEIRKTIGGIASQARCVEAAHEPAFLLNLSAGIPCELSCLDRKAVVLVSGIGAPKGFERTVQSLGAEVREHLIYPDHFVYQPVDAGRILACALRHGECDVITTMKDSVKLKTLVENFPPEVTIFSLGIEMKILSGEEVLRDAVASIFQP